MLARLRGIVQDPEKRAILRDSWLREHGYRILRVPNETVVAGGNIVLDLIREAIRQGPPAPDPP
jgi:very-short-patch-repair endonuclease